MVENLLKTILKDGLPVIIYMIVADDKNGFIWFLQKRVLTRFL